LRCRSRIVVEHRSPKVPAASCPTGCERDRKELVSRVGPKWPPPVGPRLWPCQEATAPAAARCSCRAVVRPCVARGLPGGPPAALWVASRHPLAHSPPPPPTTSTHTGGGPVGVWAAPSKRVEAREPPCQNIGVTVPVIRHNGSAGAVDHLPAPAGGAKHRHSTPVLAERPHARSGRRTGSAG